MISFKNFILNEDDKESRLSSNDKGVIHEHLVGRELNRLWSHNSEHGHHMSPAAKEQHDKIVEKIGGVNSPEYHNAHNLAVATAQAIHRHVSSQNDVDREHLKTGGQTHWTSKPGDIKRVSGHEESQQENPADIMVRYKDKAGNNKHVGYSLKVAQKKHGHVSVSNPGAKQTDEQLGIKRSGDDATHEDHYENARKELENRHSELKGKTRSEQNTIIKHPKNEMIRKSAEEISVKAIGKIRDEWYEKLQGMDSKALSDHIRKNLLRATPTKTPMYKVTTGGTGNNNSVTIEHPETHHDHILNDHQNITVKKSGNNSIEFQHKHPMTGTVTTFLRHRIKPESTPVISSLKGAAE
jgi:hypothetical protein